jgi:hypothetical protein
MRNLLLTIMFATSSVIMSSICNANCIEEPRKIDFDDTTTDNAGSAKEVVRLKSYRCSSGDGSVQLRYELFRFTSVPASLIVTKSSSSLLKKTIGLPNIVYNEVYWTYVDLLRRFGTIKSVEQTRRQEEGFEFNPPFAIEGLGEETYSSRDTLVPNRLRTIGGKFSSRELSRYESDDSIPYPAIAEFKSLNAHRGRNPADLRYYYSVKCKDEGQNASKLTCKEIESTDQVFWRGLTAADYLNYLKNLAAFNLLLKQAKQEQLKTTIPIELQLAQYLAGQNWPEDFIILLVTSNPSAGHRPDGQPSNIADWNFVAWPREIIMETILIENMSSRPLNITSLLGNRTSEPRLRADSVESRTLNPESLGAMAAYLAPGQRLLVPVKIRFAANKKLQEIFSYPQTAAEENKRAGTNGLKGFGVPSFQDYIYGAEISVGGLIANGKRIDFSEQRAIAQTFNVLDISLATLAGSCPYLLSWNKDEKDWIDHGKILHKANGSKAEYTETITFPGFQHRFKLEEREPEIAFIKSAELVVITKAGNWIRLKPDYPRLKENDGKYVRLLWGEMVEMRFTLPEQMSGEEVIESRLMVTGHYARYSDLLAMMDRKTAKREKRAIYTPMQPAIATNVSIYPVARSNLMLFADWQ